MLNSVVMFDPDKAIHALLYILQQVPDGGVHKTFKALYFAEREHLATYGAPIVSDRFIRMQNGPVPSTVYSFLKVLDGREPAALYDAGFVQRLRAHLVLNNRRDLCALTAPDLDYLAETERACLDRAIATCRPLRIGPLSELSHDAAWHQAAPNRGMDPLAIARAGGADETMLAYIRTTYENQELARQWAA